MNLQEMSLEQLKEIVDGAPELTVLIAYNKLNSPYFYDSYFKFWTGSCWIGSGFNHRNISKGFKYLIKLAEIRARIAELEKPKARKPKFNIGEWVVSTLSGQKLWHLDVCKIEGFHKTIAITKCSTGMVHHRLQQMRHATPAEIEAGHRIDSVSDEIASPCTASDSAENQAQMDLQENEPDTITVKLDPAKCRIVDPALPYDEFPIDAELKPDPVNQKSKAAKKIKKLKKRIAQLEKECQFSDLKAKDWAHKYWDSVRDNTGLYCALGEVFAERAAEYEAEIERLKGEQGE